MTKKDYEAIAGIIRKYSKTDEGGYILSNVVDDLTEYLESDNPRFDRARFLAACRGEDATDSAGRKVRYSAKPCGHNAPCSPTEHDGR